MTVTGEEHYRQLAAEARAQAVAETDPYRKRQLLLSAQHYDILAERTKRAIEARQSRSRKSG